MRVMCINDKGWSAYEKEVMLNYEANGPVYGEVCTVENSYMDGELFYNLVEYPDSNEPEHGYAASCFIPIQDQETEVESLELELIHH